MEKDEMMENAKKLACANDRKRELFVTKVMEYQKIFKTAGIKYSYDTKSIWNGGPIAIRIEKGHITNVESGWAIKIKIKGDSEYIDMVSIPIAIVEIILDEFDDIISSYGEYIQKVAEEC